MRAIHFGLARGSFGLLESLGFPRSTTRGVRRAHDLVSDTLYGGVRGVNRAVGEATRNVIASPDGAKKPEEK
jgi:hypothetical protein